MEIVEGLKANGNPPAWRGGQRQTQQCAEAGEHALGVIAIYSLEAARRNRLAQTTVHAPAQIGQHHDATDFTGRGSPG